MSHDLTAQLIPEELLLQSKALEPLAADVLARLQEVQDLDVGKVSKYSEDDVRAEVIDPIVRALGYRKETHFSTSRNKHLKVLDGDLFADYSLILFEEQFWIIEAKRVLRKELRFTADELKQAVSYAVHPEINAALVALCDGRLFQVFDREVSLVEPLVSVEIAHLVRDFDKLRVVLSPWQAWFFQKRRVLRLIDKVFGQEFNMQRLEEFRRLVNQRLNAKRGIVMDNMRRVLDRSEPNQRLQHLSVADPQDLIAIQFFGRHPTAAYPVMSKRLVQSCQTAEFETLFAIFPEQPRYATECYWSSALHFLLSLEKARSQVGWLPTYLADPSAPEKSTSVACERLIRLCLTGFAGRIGEQTVLRHAQAIRRRAKILMTMVPGASSLGQQLHALVRHQESETSIVQQISSPNANLLHLLANIQINASMDFVGNHQAEGGRFDVDAARQALRDLWAAEVALLGDGCKYQEARQGRKLGDENPCTEVLGVVYDDLGHTALCIIDQFPSWKEHVLSELRAEVERIARFGSWQAKAFLGLDAHAPYPVATSVERAQHFFSGDMGVFTALSTGYGLAVQSAT